ncbi:PREDICTED: uncharacterized protein LOC106746665 [Dinoponera quadriceps]|uniref:Uncharacterized protein LOC106746665 n=1 Tax=Dinoponera quadriceps TaxID=609295 RepID=A0A6P3XLY6_DINQU|nr:PREDICTED: uncharacterized protein LOC106746665 [Dinoponera quadriceps]
MLMIQQVKYLMEELQRICNELKDENEIIIMKKYGNIAKLCTAALMCLGASAICIYVCPLIWTHIVDVVLPTNESRTHHTMQVITEYFVDPEKYFFLILLHMAASTFIGTFILMATLPMFIAFLAYVCGMFRIASYRIEQALSNDISRKIGPRNVIRIHKEIIYAVDIHRKAMKSVFQILSFGGDKDELFLHLSYVSFNLSYMFLANYTAQEVTDHNDHVFVTTYNAQWYAVPLRIQRMILFLLQKGTKTFSLNIGGLIIGSLESFASLLSVSISYFTVIYSTQK